ncbi:MAG TPA: polysaccharide pyruvyl transferase family protein [Acetobacteraceae bacterium]|nr:polysaccharide pyruvyl transferase family protein [Acetobacteraceae bacterium]
MEWGLLSRLTAFLDQLERLVTTRRYVLVDWPDYHNTGDHLIWLGAKHALNRLGRICIADYTAWDVRSGAMPAVPPDVTVICSGGGNFGDIYPNFQRTREILAQTCRDSRLIVLPQTIYFKDPDKARDSAALFRDHPDAVIFGRDPRSAEEAAAFTAPERALLAPDCALFLYPLVSLLRERLPASPPAHETMLLARNDAEAGKRRPQLNAAGLKLDWLGKLGDYTDLTGDVEAIFATLKPDLAALFGPLTWRDDISLQRLILGILLLGQGHRLVTDRLHAHILACMLAKPHTLLDNSYGKNRQFHACWTKDIPFVSLEDPA